MPSNDISSFDAECIANTIGEAITESVGYLSGVIQDKEIDTDRELNDQLRGTCVEIAHWCYDDTLGKAIRKSCISYATRNSDDEPSSITDGLYAVSDSIDGLAGAVRDFAALIVGEIRRATEGRGGKES